MLFEAERCSSVEGARNQLLVAKFAVRRKVEKKNCSPSPLRPPRELPMIAASMAMHVQRNSNEVMDRNSHNCLLSEKKPISSCIRTGERALL